MSDSKVSFWKLIIPVVRRYAAVWWRGAFARTRRSRIRAAKAYRNLAAEFYSQDLVGFAVHCLEKARGIAPWVPEFEVDLGQVYFERQDLEKARWAFQRAVRLERENPAALRGLATTLHMLGQLDDAVYFYRLYLDREADDLEVMSNLASAYYQMGALKQAAEVLERAEGLEKNNAAVKANLARALLALGDYAKAAEKLKASIDLNPTDGEVHRLLGLCHQAVGEIEEAGESFEEAIKRDETNGRAWLDRGRIRSWMGKLSEAIADGEQAAKIFGEGGQQEDLKEAYWELGWWYFKSGDLEKAIDRNRRGLEIDPALSPVRFNLGLALLASGEAEKARKEYGAAAESVSNVADLRIHGIEDLKEWLEESGRESEDGHEILTQLTNRYEALREHQGPTVESSVSA